jgi:hypothetical protein
MQRLSAAINAQSTEADCALAGFFNGRGLVIASKIAG